MPGRKTKKMDIDESFSSQEDYMSNNEIEKCDEKETYFSNDLSNLSFKDILALQANLGTKVFNATAFKDSKIQPEPVEAVVSKPRKKYHKNDDDRPEEVSSKVRSKKTFKAPIEKERPRDPRFDENAGTFDNYLFEKKFSFLNDVRKKETLKIKKLLKKEKNPEDREKMERLLKSMDDREKSKQLKMVEHEREKVRRSEEKQKIMQGKAPYYLKSSIKKKIAKDEKLKSLKESGKLNKYLMTKDKKKLAKEGRHVVNL